MTMSDHVSDAYTITNLIVAELTQHSTDVMLTPQMPQIDECQVSLSYASTHFKRYTATSWGTTNQVAKSINPIVSLQEQGSPLSQYSPATTFYDREYENMTIFIDIWMIKLKGRSERENLGEHHSS